MRSALFGLATALLLATIACSASGSGGSGAPNATAAPSFMPTPTGGAPASDPYGY